MDGLIVTVGGKATKCQQQQVDYVQWQRLHGPSPKELTQTLGAPDAYYRGGPAIDSQNRIRVPYGFATDRWADLGNAAVYRHDNGADNYEVFDFLISQQEVNHIFDDYRRNRATFSVRAASGRILGRYNEKIRDGAKGLTLMYNIYKDFAKETGYNFNNLWAYIATQSFADQMLASSEVFDHFTRMYARPQTGWHGRVGGVLVSEDDAYGTVAHELTVPDGASLGAFGTVSVNGKLLENRLSENKGEYDSEYTMNAGSYYDKVTVPYLIAESADNFISSSRQDFLDSRYRAVSLADLFHDGYRRFVANMITGDEAVKGWGVAADATGKLLVDQDKDGNKWPKQSLGHVQWWTPETQICFPAEGTSLCTAPGNGSTFGSSAPAKIIPLDGQVGWEQQKFLIAYTMIYIPENQRQDWLDMMKVWQAGADADPGISNRIEFHDPVGKVWIASTFGKETLTHVTPAQTVQKGIAARSLEWANSLLVKAYETTDGPDLDGDSKPDWYQPTYTNGQPVVKFDPTKKAAQGPLPADCSANDNSGCKCEDNGACEDLLRYVSIIDYMRKAGLIFWQFPLGQKGIYN